MPTNNPRINITLEPKLMDLVASIAEKEDKSVSSLSKELIIEALERREDKVLSTIAKKRDTAKARKVKHNDAWK